MLFETKSRCEVCFTPNTCKHTGYGCKDCVYDIPHHAKIFVKYGVYAKLWQLDRELFVFMQVFPTYGFILWNRLGKWFLNLDQIHSFYYTTQACMFVYIIKIKLVMANLWLTVVGSMGVSIIDKFMVMFYQCVSADILLTYCWWYFVSVFVLIYIYRNGYHNSSVTNKLVLPSSIHEMQFEETSQFGNWMIALPGQ